MSFIAIKHETHEVERWRVKGFAMPRRTNWVDAMAHIPTRELFDTEKLAIDYARKLRIDEIDRLQAEVTTLDERYDRIEDEEMRRRDG